MRYYVQQLISRNFVLKQNWSNLFLIKKIASELRRKNHLGATFFGILFEHNYMYALTPLPIFHEQQHFNKIYPCREFSTTYNELKVGIVPICGNFLSWKIKLRLLSHPVPSELWDLLEILPDTENYLYKYLNNKDVYLLFLLIRKLPQVKQAQLDNKCTKIWRELRKFRKPFDEKSYNFLLLKGPYSLRQEILDEMVFHNYIPNIAAFSRLIEDSCRAQDTFQARHWFRVMHELKQSPDARIYNLLVYTHTNLTQELSLAKYFLGKMIDVGLLPVQSVIFDFMRQSLNSNQSENFDWAFERFFRGNGQKGFQATIDVYHILLEIFAKQSSFELAQKYFDDMIKVKRLEPNEMTFQSLINAYVGDDNWDKEDSTNISQSSRLQKALKIFKEMKPTHHIIATLDTHLLLIRRILYPSKFLNINDIDFADLNYLTKSLLEDIPRVHWEKVSDSLFIDIFSILVNHNFLTQSHAIYFELRKRDNSFALDNGASVLIKKHCKARDLFSALQIYYDLGSVGIKAELDAYACIMQEYNYRNDPDGAMKFYEFASLTNPIFNKDFYQPLLEVCVYNRRAEYALEVLEDLIRRSYRPDVYMYNITLYGLFKSRNCESAKRLFQDMQKRGIRPQVATYNILIQGYGNVMPDLSEVINTYQLMIAARCEPDSKTYGNLMMAHIRHGDLDRARKVFKANVAANKPVDIRAACDLMKKLAKVSDIDFCWKVYHQLKLEKKLCKEIFQVAFYVGYLAHDDEKVKDVLTELHTQGVKIDLSVIKYLGLQKYLGRRDSVKFTWLLNLLSSEEYVYKKLESTS
ncbi:14445_t:CDS:1 [Ambispora leptoticha]|uniref:14445_t:CDS:1 n=1 Tax=Ambispora leptoticha TaxID=144679 RepID=A0A9N9B4F6_9GLOM|nr:14445_t:CDS:1 [Ambispora leptoticha]